MSQETLVAKVRHSTGKRANRQLRTADKIPAVLYGTGPSVMLEMDQTVTRRFIGKMAGVHQLVPLSVTDDNGNTEEHQVLLQEIQKHPYKQKLVHLDFRKLDETKSIAVKIPLRTVGDAPGVKKGGTLQLIVREVPVKCSPNNIPEFIDVDVSALDFHENIRVMDIKYPESVEPTAKQNFSVAGIIGRKND